MAEFRGPYGAGLDEGDLNRRLRRITSFDVKEDTMGRLLDRLAPGRNVTPAMVAEWNGEVIAESDETVVVEGNHYFPLAAVQSDVLRRSRRRSVCPWKGLASYYDVVVGDAVNPNAAWNYPHPSPLARRIKGHVAFWNGVTIRPADASPPASDSARRTRRNDGQATSATSRA